MYLLFLFGVSNSVNHIVVVIIVGSCCTISSCPSLLILDDLEVLCPMRDTHLSEVELRGVACLSALMDSLCSNPPPAHMVVVATTHHLERVELNLRRPGRFEKELELPVPTSTERLDVCAQSHFCI